LVIVGVFFGVQVLVGLLIGVGIGVYNGLQARHGGITIPTGGGATVMIVAQIAGLLLGGLVAFCLAWESLSEVPGERSLAGIGWSIGSRHALLLATLAGLLLAGFYFMILVPHFPPRPDYVGGPLAQVAGSAGWPRHAWAVLALLLAPPTEEFFFRGVMFAGICRSGGRVLAAVSVTVLFVALHATEAFAYWPAIVAISLLALGTMVVRIAADALGPAMALHAAYNFGVVLCVYGAAA
jgi:membrane protease YdiL (CAAX protease family)